MQKIPRTSTPPPLYVLLMNLGDRISKYRIARGIRQQDLAESAGISRRTLTNLEGGSGATLETMLRILRALDIEERFLDLVPNAEINPLDHMAARRRPRQRVRPSKKSEHAIGWKWGDCDGGGN